MDFKAINEAEIAKYEKEVYGDELMPVHNKEVLRNVLEKEDKFWMAWDARVDNNNSHDDQ